MAAVRARELEGHPLKIDTHRCLDSSGDETTTPGSGQSPCSPPSRSSRLDSDDGIEADPQLVSLIDALLKVRGNELGAPPGLSHGCPADTSSENAGQGELKNFTTHGEIWSKGSVNHPVVCTPCAFYCFKKVGCADGKDCNYCHMQHTSNTQSRREEWKRRQREKHRREEAPAAGEAPQGPLLAAAKCEAGMMAAQYDIPAAQVDPQLVALGKCLNAHGNDSEAQLLWEPANISGLRCFGFSGDEAVAPGFSRQSTCIDTVPSAFSRQSTCTSRSPISTWDSDDDMTSAAGVALEDRKSLRTHGEMWSKGSTNHPSGCTPCAFYCFKRPGCADGKDCNFCHMQHTSKTQSRREEWKRRQREKHQREEAPAAEVAMMAARYDIPATQVDPQCEIPATQVDPQLVTLLGKCLNAHGNNSEAQLLGEPANIRGLRRFDFSGDETVAPASGQSTCTPRSPIGTWDSDDGIMAYQFLSDSNECATKTISEGAATEDRKSLRTHGEMWSKGSTNHPSGCTPCAFYCFKRPGCADGKDCNFCHMQHTSKTQSRREEWKRRQRGEHRREQAPPAGKASDAPKPANTKRVGPSPAKLPLPRMSRLGDVSEIERR